MSALPPVISISEAALAAFVLRAILQGRNPRPSDIEHWRCCESCMSAIRDDVLATERAHAAQEATP